MARFASLGYLSLLALAACGPRPAVSTLKAGSSPAYYETFAAGETTTDQTSGAPGTHSYLVGSYGDGSEKTDVRDDDFAVNVAKPALAAGASLFLSLGECYSGGLLDELAALGGNQAVVSSARHTETASYGYEAPEGVDIDYTDAFIQSLGDGTQPAEAVIRGTAALDPFGPNPDAARIGEEMGSEHTQYLATGSGGAFKLADHAQGALAVLWAGMPNERDGAQMNRMVDQLVGMGVNRDNIYMLYGEGVADDSYPVVKNHIAGQTAPIHLAAATRTHLVDVVSKAFAAESAPDAFFLYVGDHGGLDEQRVAKRNFGRADTLIRPGTTHGRLYGSGYAQLP